MVAQKGQHMAGIQENMVAQKDNTTHGAKQHNLRYTVVVSYTKLYTIYLRVEFP